MKSVSHSVAINPYPSKGEIVVLFSGDAQTKPNHHVGPQVLDHHLLHYVVSGKGKFQCLGKEYALERGDSFFIFPGDLISYVSDEDDPWQYCWIGFKGNYVDQLLSQMNISAHHPVISTENHEEIVHLFTQIKNVLKQAKTSCDLQTSGFMRVLLSQYADVNMNVVQHARNVSKLEQQIEHAIKWMTLQYSQPISIDGMAQELGYHRTYFSKKFREHTGMSPMHFLLKIRMERAKLLMHDSLTIDQIASSVGYPDALYFSKQFKKWFGKSPTDYRMSLSIGKRYDCSTQT